MPAGISYSAQFLPKIKFQIGDKICFSERAKRELGSDIRNANQPLLVMDVFLARDFHTYLVEVSDAKGKCLGQFDQDWLYLKKLNSKDKALRHIVTQLDKCI